jgi:N6-adenosine-specific RNA methylase IME4
VQEPKTQDSRPKTAFDREIEGLSARFSTILLDPPWRFQNRTGKMAPEHRRLRRYETMSFDEIGALPVGDLGQPDSHLYMWCPNALLIEGLAIMKQWGFTYKTNLVWYKIRKDGGPDGRGVGFYFRNVTELVLFGVKGRMRTEAPGRRQVNVISTRKEEHSKKPDVFYDVIEACSPGPYVELFARLPREGWTQLGNEIESYAARRPLIPMYNAFTHPDGQPQADPGNATTTP